MPYIPPTTAPGMGGSLMSSPAIAQNPGIPQTSPTVPATAAGVQQMAQQQPAGGPPPNQPQPVPQQIQPMAAPSSPGWVGDPLAGKGNGPVTSQVQPLKTAQTYTTQTSYVPFNAGLTMAKPADNSQNTVADDALPVLESAFKQAKAGLNSTHGVLKVANMNLLSKGWQGLKSVAPNLAGAGIGGGMGYLGDTQTGGNGVMGTIGGALFGGGLPVTKSLQNLNGAKPSPRAFAEGAATLAGGGMLGGKMTGNMIMKNRANTPVSADSAPVPAAPQTPPAKPQIPATAAEPGISSQVMDHLKNNWGYYAGAGIGIPALMYLYKRMTEDPEKQSAAKTAKCGGKKKKMKKKAANVWSGIKSVGNWLGKAPNAIADSPLANIAGRTVGFGAGYTGRAMTAPDVAPTTGNPTPDNSLLGKMLDPQNASRNIAAGLGGALLLSPAGIRGDWRASAEAAKHGTPTLQKYLFGPGLKSFGMKSLVAGAPDIAQGTLDMFKIPQHLANTAKTLDNTVTSTGKNLDTAVKATGDNLSEASKSIDTAAKDLPSLTGKLDQTLEVLNNMTKSNPLGQATDKITNSLENSGMNRLSNQMADGMEAAKGFLKNHGGKLGLGLGVGLPALYLLGKYLGGGNNAAPASKQEEKKRPIGIAAGTGAGPTGPAKRKPPRLTLRAPGDYRIAYQDKDEYPDLVAPEEKTANMALLGKAMNVGRRLTNGLQSTGTNLLDATKKIPQAAQGLGSMVGKAISPAVKPSLPLTTDYVPRGMLGRAFNSFDSFLARQGKRLLGNNAGPIDSRLVGYTGAMLPLAGAAGAAVGPQSNGRPF